MTIQNFFSLLLLKEILKKTKQESGLRAGTENVAGIVGLGKAAELASNHLQEMDSVIILRDKLEAGIRGLIPDAILNGHSEHRLPNTLNMSFRFDTISLEKTTVQLARRSSNPLKKKNTPNYTSLKQK